MRIIPDTHKSILIEAEGLVHGDRNETYGHPLSDYERTVGAFKALQGEDKKISEMTPQDGVIFMICMKLSREVNLHKRDNCVDGAGYFECLDWMHDEEKRRQEQSDA